MLEKCKQTYIAFQLGQWQWIFTSARLTANTSTWAGPWPLNNTSDSDKGSVKSFQGCKRCITLGNLVDEILSSSPQVETVVKNVTRLLFIIRRTFIHLTSIYLCFFSQFPLGLTWNILCRYRLYILSVVPIFRGVWIPPSTFEERLVHFKPFTIQRRHQCDLPTALTTRIQHRSFEFLPNKNRCSHDLRFPKQCVYLRPTPSLRGL